MQSVVCYTYHTHRVEIVSVVIVTNLWFFHRYRFHFLTVALFRTEPKKRACTSGCTNEESKLKNLKGARVGARMRKLR